MIEVEENSDGTFNISWDENDPSESMFNTWTEEDFVRELGKAITQLSKNETI